MRSALSVLSCAIVFLCLLSVTGLSLPARAADPLVGWGEPERITPDEPGDAQPPRLAVDASGNAIAVWEQWDTIQHSIWSSRYVVGEGWGEVMLVETNDTEVAYSPLVAMDASGNAVAVWAQSNGMTGDLWANCFIVGEGWKTPERMEWFDEYAGLNSIAVDASGNATVAFWVYDGHQSMYANQYVVGEGWSIPVPIGDGLGDDDYAQVAVDGSGNAFVVWQRYDGLRWDAWANRYDMAGGWGGPEPIEANDSGDVGGLRVVADDAGNAVAMWVQWADGEYNVWSNGYIAGVGWDAPELVETDDTGDAFGPEMSGDGAGNVMAVWRQHDGLDYNLWSNLYVAGEGWQGAVLAETQEYEVNYIDVSLDWSGNATAVWVQYDNVRLSLFSSRYVTGEGWGDAELVESNDSATARFAEIACEWSGNVIAMWLMDDGSGNSVWANRFIAPDIVPPVLSIDSPSDGLVTEVATVMVSGVTEPSATLIANGVYLVVDDNGSFSFVLALLEGENTITATATDASGNSAHVSINVTYVNPVYALEEQLAAALADLAAVQEELDAALDAVADLQAQLDDALADIGSLEAQLAAALASLAATEAQLNSTIEVLADLQEQFDEASEDLSTLQTLLDDALTSVVGVQEDLLGALEDLAAAQDELDALREELAATDGDLEDAQSLVLLLALAFAVSAMAALVAIVMYLGLKRRTGAQEPPEE